MLLTTRQRRAAALLLTLCAGVAAAAGFFCGKVAAETRNIQRNLNIGEYIPSLPSQLLDRQGKLITEFFAEERREIVSINELPKHLLYAVIAKEDRTFFSHRGFSIKGFLRAAWNNLTGNYFSGGSTISQQVAGNLYEDRSVSTISRKLKELWWSLQLEKKRSKFEILQLYLNNSPFGHGTYGVESASRFYFGHPARDLSLAEAACIVAPLSSKSINSPISNPNRVRIIQKATLEGMVMLGFTTRENADRSYEKFWASYDLTRPDTSTAFTERQDKAPEFSEYIRDQFDRLLFGNLDLLTGGYVIHTTLDLEYQREAARVMESALTTLSARHRSQTALLQELIDGNFVAPLELLSLTFKFDELDFEKYRQKDEAYRAVKTEVLPALSAISLVSGLEELRHVLDILQEKTDGDLRKQNIEGALITIENETGHIVAMVGGTDPGTSQRSRALTGRIQTGSAIMPLYYAAAIDARAINPADLFFDSPVVFVQDDGTTYVPQAYLDSWAGPVTARTALSRSLNIPAFKVLDELGVPRAAEKISQFLSLEGDSSGVNVPHTPAIGLGIAGVSPLQMASAFAVFPNLGRPVAPLSFTFIEDRYGNIIYNNEQTVLNETAKRRNVIGAATAYIITDMLEDVVAEGTLSKRFAEAGGVGRIPMVGKTGTTLNWSDAWTVGYSPYYTTAIWFGFDEPGNSLGRFHTGSLTAGPVWIEYMKNIHSDLPRAQFSEPTTGLIRQKVCAVSGKLPTEICNEGIETELFLTGTEPDGFCEYHIKKLEIEYRLKAKLKDRFLFLKLSMPPEDKIFRKELEGPAKQENAEPSAKAVEKAPVF